jgi:hypothetical protein
MMQLHADCFVIRMAEHDLFLKDSALYPGLEKLIKTMKISQSG